MNDFLPEETEEVLEPLTTKEWRKLVDEFVFKKKRQDDGLIERVNPAQYFCLNEIKKSHNRNK